jgi:hypothetical protein
MVIIEREMLHFLDFFFFFFFPKFRLQICHNSTLLIILKNMSPLLLICDTSFVNLRPLMSLVVCENGRMIIVK